ncbi:tRNA 2-selenouridine(34) synthase MnmH [Adhaeribacter sp. BT258]|uniref:tRNA 2-selenouridine(34) synthase MnmH n=1 Tax=Adhaeribacter terrigena TaxID=2793070 RepID=A0ABS1C4S3_9BACT|nr:tRNA 2-selenouridine(34) synthase MnmH [Adhaeribacter terrigena]MBK0404389.1 tRNA 2-selenouridine(34) synthase MnmH [Adhaeribacter terrigena]
MINKIPISEVLRLKENLPLLDIRSPKEFAAGHIPGALSFPLFSDEERHQIGTAYKQISQEKAVLMGLDFFGPNMSAMVKQAKKLAPQKEVLLHCWRGGMRSQSVAWLLDLAGFNVHLLDFGYKSYRHFALETFAQKYPLLILGGATGSGKTDILTELQKLDEPVIDLEKLASHKGSAFGTIGMPPQGSIEQFENDLALELAALDLSKTTWLEDESISIGKVNIPRPFYDQMRAATVLKLEIPREVRVKKLAEEYCKVDKAVLANSITRIQKRLGGLATKEALAAIEEGDMEKMVEIALVYYDKAYQFELDHKENIQIINVPLETTNAAENAEIVLEVAKKNGMLLR